KILIERCLVKYNSQNLAGSAMQVWVLRVLAGVADAFGDDEPDHNAATPASTLKTHTCIADPARF
ncbi:MAG: hypothetical protein ACKODZ_06025, partial [Verrucomicrobiota bacterium]